MADASLIYLINDQSQSSFFDREYNSVVLGGYNPRIYKLTTYIHRSQKPPGYTSEPPGYINKTGPLGYTNY